MWGALFPGQGSQSVGMGKFLYDEFPFAKRRFEEASDFLLTDFRKLCFEGPESTLALTENSQTSLLLVSTLTYDLLTQNTGIVIQAGAGHSVGEYAALVASGVLKFSDALHATRARGRSMQRAVPVGEGAMIAVLGLEDEQAQEICLWTQQASGALPLEAANFNSPGQVVISGSAKACDWLIKNAASENFKSAFPELPKMRLIPLKVSAPFHCSLMKPAESEMRKLLEKIKFSEPHWPVVQNFAAQTLKDPDLIREHLIRQITAPVMWTACFQKLVRMGCQNFIEFGNGKVLSGLAKKIDSSGVTTFNINNLEEWNALERKVKSLNPVH